MIATTSFFTSQARDFEAAVRYRLSLQDYNDLMSWIGSYRSGNN